MFFFFKRSRVTGDVLNIIRPLVGTILISDGIPKRFWSDPYVLGFLFTFSGLLTRMASNNTIKPDNLSSVIRNVIAAVSNLNPAPIATAANKFRKEKNTAFIKGVGAATVLYFYQAGVMKEQNIDFVKQAAIAEGMQWDEEAEKLIREGCDPGFLQVHVWNDAVAERFGFYGDDSPAEKEESFIITLIEEGLMPLVVSQLYSTLEEAKRAAEDQAFRKGWGNITWALKDPASGVWEGRGPSFQYEFGGPNPGYVEVKTERR